MFVLVVKFKKYTLIKNKLHLHCICFNQKLAQVPNKDQMMGGLIGTLQGATNMEFTRPRQVILSVGVSSCLLRQVNL